MVVSYTAENVICDMTSQEKKDCGWDKFEALEAQDEKIKASYRKRGFVKSAQDEADLHMSFSPNRVPRGLTKLQIRRRINKFVRNGRKLKPISEVVGNRMNIFINDKFVAGVSFGGKVPQNSRQLKRLIRAAF